MKNKKGSVLAYSLIILAMMLGIATSLSISTIIEKKSASATEFSTQSLQTADSGIQLALKKINNNLTKQINNPSLFSTCSGGVVTGLNDAGQGIYELSFYSDNGTTLASCNSLANKIKNIKSVGTYKNTVRAVSVAVVAPAAPCNASTVCGTSCSYNGDDYATVTIGTQCWFAENLRTTKKPDGSNLTEGSGMYSNPVGSGSPWGRLYDWYTAMNGSASVTNAPGPQGICPTGWHIPTDNGTATSTNEVWTLENYVSGQVCDAARINAPSCNTAGTKMTSGGSSGFNLFLSGYYGSGLFNNRNSNGYFWSATAFDPTLSWLRYFNVGDPRVGRSYSLKTYGLSVRCIKN